MDKLSIRTALPRTTTEPSNELPSEVLCHNICCAIQSMYELGIEAHLA